MKPEEKLALDALRAELGALCAVIPAVVVNAGYSATHHWKTERIVCLKICESRSPKTAQLEMAIRTMKSLSESVLTPVAPPAPADAML